ncbi:MAG: rhomboid family intrarane serine protease [Pseudonocardiales bacterium]|jgi:membrane associated rhomboid family serine protease|nr:rhomboid family intrarane serine protease [Pseudonocardiales bacterium]
MTPPDGDMSPHSEVAPPAPHCYRHPNRETLIRCTRCDRPICPDCMRPASVGFHCPDDVGLANKTVRQPRTAVGARLMNSPPFVTWGLIGANVIVYLITAAQSVKGITQPGDGSSWLFRDWQLFPNSIHNNHEYYRLITSGFLHVSLLHIASNMLALFIIGPLLERLLGRWRFALVYLIGLLGGSAAVYTWGQVSTAEVGASGAVFGLFAAALVLVRKLGLDAQWLIGIIVLNFVFTFSIHNISKLAHIGGFIAGALATLAIAGLPQVRERVSLRTQVAGLAALAVLIIVIVAVRTVTFPSPVSGPKG